MKNDARLAALVKKIDFHGFSRNKNFDAYQDPMVRDARDRLNRLHRLADMLSADESDQWEVSLEPHQDRFGLWTLTCQSSRRPARWIAKLRDFELEILRHYSRAEVLRSTV